MKLMITGGSGALGNALKKMFPGAYAPTSKDVNVCNKQAVKKAIKNQMPDILIHAAAMVGVRECEDNKEKAWEVNVEGTQNVIDALNELNPECYLVYVSTACVFAGEEKKFYSEADVPSPKNFYSFTKSCGELLTRQYDNSCIIRTNFVAKEKWKYPGAFIDRFGTYLFSDQVAQGIKDVCEEKKTEIIHIVGKERMSMYDLAVLAGSNVKKMTLDQYQGPPVTIDMSLSTKKWKQYQIK